MSSSEQKNFNYSGQKPIVVDSSDKPSKRPYLIGFIVFLVLAIGLVVFALWWFVWRDSNSPLNRPCTRDTQCAPNEICNGNTNQCNAVPCTINSECNGIANGAGGGFCVNGWCQTAACSSNSDCSNLGDNYACSAIPTNPNIPSATPWLTTACVQTGNSCSTNNDCFGGNYGLVCDKSDGNDTGVCVQCAQNSDCGGGLVCDTDVNLCTACDDSDEHRQCGDNNVCGNGTCCSNPQYMVNNTFSCVRGELFDLCVTDTDCKSGHCINLSSAPGNEGVADLKVCGGGDNGTMTFSAGVRIAEGVGNPNIIRNFTCNVPGGPDDFDATPFAVNGACSLYSANTDNVNGSACGIPTYCREAAHSANILCNGQVTFENPFVTSCNSIDQCGEGQGCGNDNICGQACNTSDGNSQCSAGYVCLKQTNTSRLPSGSDGVCQYPTDKISCTSTACEDITTCQCPALYGCSANNTCVWSGNDSGANDPDTPPPPLVIESVCSRPATALPQSTNGQLLSNGYIPSYCVSGFCNTTPGWINSVCVEDGDCMYLGNDVDNTRLGLNCTTRGDTKICQQS